MKKISVFLPVRKGSQRVINKNTRKFSDFENGLLELKLKQLLKVDSISEIVLSSNDENCLEIGRSFSANSTKVKVYNRPDQLGSSETDLIDLVKYVPSICTYDHILWTHVTSPFFCEEDYANAIKKYSVALSSGFDSLMSVKKYNNFLWSAQDQDIINRQNLDSVKWPRTQDLKELYEIDSAVFIADKSIYNKYQNRIGLKPSLLIQDGIKSFDIDWEEDFNIAEILYEKKIR